MAISETLNQNNLQRGGKSINWIWNTESSRSPDIQRRRRYLIDETSDQWWNDMKTIWDPSDGAATTTNPLSPEEDIYFSGRGGHSSPFSNLQSLPAQMNTTVEAAIMVENPQHSDVDSSLIRELIIEEHHKPSKIELQSVSQRLRDIKENNTAIPEPPIKTENESKTEELREIESEEPVVTRNEGGNSPSFVEYVVPGVEFVEPYVEYVNKHDAFRESESISQQPFVEYVLPSVEYIEPEIEYFTTRMSNSSKNVESFPLDDSSEEEFFGRRGLPLEEVITIDQNRFLAVHNEEKITSETKRAEKQRTIKQSVRHQRIHRRNPGWGIPEVDYPTLEILPVVHFPCEEYASPGYYADVSSRCQMFHICHENGQRSSFLCPIGTVFNQEYLVCDWWYNVDCGNSLNHDITDSYEAFGTSEEKISLPSIAKPKVDSISWNKDNKNHSDKLSLFSAVKMKPEVNNKFQHSKKTAERHPNLSQKAINYPIGYALLLREFVKNSPRFSPNQPEDSKHTENPGTQKLENIKEFPNESKIASDNERILQKNNENLKNKGNTETETKKGRQKQEYYGGSKPFSLSEKRIHERVRTKRIKIRYFPRESQKLSSASNYTSEESEPDPESQVPIQEYNAYAPYIHHYGTKSRINRKNTKEKPVNNKMIIVSDNPINVPDQRNYYNITDEFEIIHLQRSNNKPKNTLIKKYPKHNYSSAASIANYKKELYSDDDDQLDEVDDLHHLENVTEKRNNSSDDHTTEPENRHSTTLAPLHKKRQVNNQTSSAGDIFRVGYPIIDYENFLDAEDP
ncbi:uncharacterized protein LOC129975461 [Argiope bruennichi]|uniref:uncharacterized protein LOC129975461 n=1 Tax=Argiope bruennichi TaxID=94029 RepID=UPI002494DC16|nr:uncharacterized protein LOC129975461 [Argiope bruennichi]